MHKPIYKLLLVLLPIIAVSCKKDTLLTYKGANNVYFDYITTSLNEYDSLNVSFAYSDASVTDSIIKIPLAVTGLASSTDRTYTIAVDPSSSAKAGTHYVLPDTFTFHAGLLIDTLPVKLIRTPDLQDTSVMLMLDLKPNKDFTTDIQFLYDRVNDTLSALTFKLVVSDELTAGPYWTGIFAAYFGNFSVKKVKLMNQVVSMPLNFWVDLTNLSLSAQAAYYAIAMSRYLRDQVTAGTPVYEADGVTLMVMGASYQ
jgi:hypothetical protein